MRVCVRGPGHLGLPPALLFATGYEVVGADADDVAVEALRDGTAPLAESGDDAPEGREDGEPR